jgi:hypothetical protein
VEGWSVVDFAARSEAARSLGQGASTKSARGHPRPRRVARPCYLVPDDQPARGRLMPAEDSLALGALPRIEVSARFSRMGVPWGNPIFFALERFS